MLALKVCTAIAATSLLATSTLSAQSNLSGPLAVVQDSGPRTAVATVQSDYWLGVSVSLPSPALRAQLKLPKDQGIVVDAVEPDSPAMKADIKEFDVLLNGNDKPLTGLDSLVRLTSEVKEGKLKLELLRAGKHEAVTATLAKRPAAFANRPDDTAAGLARYLAESLGSQNGPLRFKVVHPGQILPPLLPEETAAYVDAEFVVKTKLSDGSEVEISRKGAEPAKVLVKHDKDKWEATSDDLSKIPEKVRPEVEKLLHATRDHQLFFALNRSPAGVAAGVTAVPGFSGSFPVSPDVEKRLGELQKQVDELRHAVEVLQGNERSGR
jgi:hypothetical protein